MNHPEQGARIMGLHLEGNYLNMAMKGGQDPNYIYPPNPQEYKELLNSTNVLNAGAPPPSLTGLWNSVNMRQLMVCWFH
mgnify:FL=1